MKRDEQPEKPCHPYGQSLLQSREIKFCLSVGFSAEQTRNLVALIEIHIFRRTQAEFYRKRYHYAGPAKSDI